MTIEELAAKLDELNADALNIQAKADVEEREFTESESEELDGIFDRVETVKKQIAQREQIEAQAIELSKGRGRKTEPVDVDDQPRKQKTRAEWNERPEDKGRWGFRSFGEFAQTVKNACQHGGQRDVRLTNISNAATTYSSEGSGQDGGFAVPPDFRQAIVEKVMGEDALLTRTDQLVTSSNSITVPIDETTPWQTTGGIQAYWEGEGDALAQSKALLQQRNVRLNKLTALVPVTEELLDDAPALDGYLRRKAPEKMNFKLNLAIVQGNGVGQPLGILNAPCTISVAQEAGPQAADTIVFANIVKMWSRLDSSCRANAVWLINQDIEPQLMLMEFPGTTSNVPAYLPPGGLSASPYATIMGKPVIPTQACETLGDKGDIILCDLNKYLSVTKGGGIRADMSIHLWFDQDITAFRFIFRVAGLPWWASAISPRDGSTTHSCFVTLDDRTGS